MKNKLHQINEKLTEWAKWCKKGDKFLYFEGSLKQWEKVYNFKKGRVKLEEYTDKEYFDDFFRTDIGEFDKEIKNNKFHYIIAKTNHILGNTVIDWEEVLKQTFRKPKQTKTA